MAWNFDAVAKTPEQNRMLERIALRQAAERRIREEFEDSDSIVAIAKKDQRLRELAQHDDLAEVRESRLLSRIAPWVLAAVVIALAAVWVAADARSQLNELEQAISVLEEKIEMLD